jgi:hypothetical protein
VALSSLRNRPDVTSELTTREAVFTRRA